jgi:two-component system sensor histidine kinase UhpB
VITPDPANEIAEKWQDAKELAGFSLLLFVVVNVVLYAVVTRALRPLDQVLAVLRGVENGNLHARLPALRLREFTRIAESFNRMADALEHGAEQNRRLTLKLMQAQEEERRRIARELHDELGQSLTGIQADAAAIRRNSQANPLVRDSADAIAGATQQLLASVRGMLHRLRPQALEAFGLAAALRELVDGWQRRNPAIACTLHIDGDVAGQPDDTALAVYRSVQEALTNVARHSGATRVEVALRRIGGVGDDRLVLAVHDDGRGAAPGARNLGLGLRGIGERAAALGGSLVIPTGRPCGFGIELELPVGKALAW